MNPLELIALARVLVDGVIAGDLDSATQTELRRAVSCAYYAMFHTLALSNANTLIGASPADQQRWAWQQTYRAADHRPTRNKLSSASLGGRFPRAIRRFGVAFADVQRVRHSADYDPEARFVIESVLTAIEDAASAMAAFEIVSEKDRRAFAVYVTTPLPR